MKVFVSTIPFGEANPLSKQMLSDNGIEYSVNPFGRKITTEELADAIGDADALVAGTEVIDHRVFDRAPNLKLIARVGIGLDGLDLLEAKNRGIACTYTPDAPAPAVAELTIGLMINQLRHISKASSNLKEGAWERLEGRRISELTIGVIGTGRIGSRVIRRLSAFGTPEVLANSLIHRDEIDPRQKISWVTKNEIFERADVVTIHTPLTEKTRDLVTIKELAAMKRDAILINTARGGIVNESDLHDALSDNLIQSAAIDVFEEEPYEGPLTSLQNCTLTCHMGSMSKDCRARMEIEAVQEVINFRNGLPLEKPVPDSEYYLRK